MITDGDIIEALVRNTDPHTYGEKAIIINKLDILKFARAIEVKVRDEYEPRFKVGDRVKFMCQLGKKAGTVEAVCKSQCPPNYWINVGTSVFPVDVYVSERHIFNQAEPEVTDNETI